MTEVIRAVQWNIGGGKIMDPARVPPAGAPHEAYGPYDIDGLDAIISTLAQTGGDVITLQETHTSKNYSQAAEISDALGLSYWVNDSYGESHIDPNYQLGQAIISRFPLRRHEFRQFIDAGYKAPWATRIHNKGLTSVLADIGSEALIETLHTVPFKAFGVDQTSAQAKPALDDMQAKIVARKHSLRLLQGDFNLHGETLTLLLPELFAKGFQEVPQTEATTPWGYAYDHVLYAGFAALGSTVITGVPTDHSPIVSVFAL
ncbi:MAG TPA: endonuclease/exonuclease/phosphatase family protein [Candidatus Saccharimonadales bacterium]|nr:endonuclease/exonuclease/phosphatase family protein [Candidatus Saccharimonadales bacterium]